MEKPGGTIIKSYQDLIAWQRAMDLVVLSYQLARKLPKDERYGLVSQIQRSATSVPANIAEGQGRGSATQFLPFLRIANGSLLELETHVQAAQRLGMLESADVMCFLTLSGEVGRIIAGLVRSLRNRVLHPTGHGPLATGNFKS